MKLCPKCGTQFPNDANFCPTDAARLVEDERASAAGQAAVAQPASGARVLGGRFVLGERVGGGQTGEVHRGTDQKNDRPCVIKLVDASVFPSNLAMQRTERELSKLSRLDSEGIAKILGHGKEDSTLWIASELVPDCQSLHDLVFDEGPMPVERAAALVVKVGKALAEAARMGVIHRDLAPKNLLMSASGAVKIINFGVAVPTTGKVHGVAEFVAPEIIEGKQPDQRANIYSLGGLFYYLLTGRPPYMGEPEEVYAQHLKGTPEPPSAHVEGISEAVDGLILRALERTSSKRFMTLRQLLGDVERVAEGAEPLSAAPSVARMGRGKNPKLAQTMLGGFRVVEGAVTKSGSTEMKGEAKDSGSAGAAGSTLSMGSPAVAPDQNDQEGQQEQDGAPSAGAGPASPEAAQTAGAAGEASCVAESKAGPEAGGAASAAEDTSRDRQAAPASPAAGDAAEPAPAGGDKSAASAADEDAWFEKSAGADAPSSDARDRGSLGQNDQERASLETGAAAVMRNVQAEGAESKSPAASSVSDRELINEMKGGRGKIVAAIVIGILLVGILIALAAGGGQ